MLMTQMVDASLNFNSLSSAFAFVTAQYFYNTPYYKTNLDIDYYTIEYALVWLAYILPSNFTKEL